MSEMTRPGSQQRNERIEWESSGEWHPIETAPKDGTSVLLIHRDSPQIPWAAQWRPYWPRGPEAGYWYSVFDCGPVTSVPDQWPTHWAKIPEFDGT